MRNIAEILLNMALSTTNLIKY